MEKYIKAASGEFVLFGDGKFKDAYCVFIYSDEKDIHKIEDECPLFFDTERELQ